MAALLIGGGDADPNLGLLADAAAAKGVDVIRVLAGSSRPRIDWDLERDVLTVDGDAVAPTALFLRHDVFGGQVDPRPSVGFRASAWSALLHGWALSHPGVRYMNRSAAPGTGSKPFILQRARALGLHVPRTRITNARESVRAFGSGIAKPVAGGGLAHDLGAALRLAGDEEDLAAPALVQETLVQPELRVYVVGTRTFAFWVRSSMLDYRADPETVVEFCGPAPTTIADALLRLARLLGLDFGAADFKSRPDGSLVFLEMNSGPMFGRFGQESGGALTAAMVEWLCAA